MIEELKQTLDKVNNTQTTENGALGYSTSGQNLVDLNFRVPSNHNNVEEKDLRTFMNSLKEDKVNTIKWMFYLRDIREGLGERDSFVRLFVTLYLADQETALAVLPLIPVYGRWKDVIDLLNFVKDGTPLADAVYELIGKQLSDDCLNVSEGKSISLLAKWMPSVNATPKSRKLAVRICRHMGLLMVDYRKMLSLLRSHLDVTEVKTCAGEWDKIDYNKVSSNANSRYLKAFVKHDGQRRKKYLQDLANPEKSGAVMHASNLYPHEVFSKYSEMYYNADCVTADAGIEALWNNLKDTETIGNTLVVVDGSGSMLSLINGSSSVRAIDVSRSLGAFFSERCEGEFKNKMIEFSARPRYIDLSRCQTLADKFNVMKDYTSCSNTDLERVFDMILKTAVDNHLPQSELPNTLLIPSDMEFDEATAMRNNYWNNHEGLMAAYQTLFETIKKKWGAHGYTLPKIVFWCVNSRTKTIPVTSNECGVILVSGFSVNNIKMILSGEINPWKALRSVLDSERYDAVAQALSE